MSSVITVENLSKRYVISHQRQGGYPTLRDALADGARRFTRKLRHPFAAPENDRAHEQFWALKDVSFSIQLGDRVGIIGRNGAGKSTLLKILSRITEPSSGQIRIRGRVSSLLEVGTGFHPELTGRENIFLNGAILGMSKAEIKTRFDEIVDFAEVERFLDTPVKHYSSGMYVRLAFAVAAHLEPEVLIVDEVLAVGDAQFQQKCIEKMNNVARDGRTIIFVSHSMGMLAKLCNNAIMLDRGCVVAAGTAKDVIEHYLGEAVANRSEAFYATEKEGKEIYIESVHAANSRGEPTSAFSFDEPVRIVLRCVVNRWVTGSMLGVYVVDQRGRKVFSNNNGQWLNLQGNRNAVKMAVTIPGGFLVPGSYSASFVINVPRIRNIDVIEDAISFNIIDTGSPFAAIEGQDYGCVFANCTWEMEDGGDLGSAPVS